jgi:hypothetical protein
MAAAAKAQGVLDAADRLADLVMQIAGLVARPQPQREQEQPAGEPESSGTADVPPAQVAQ